MPILVSSGPLEPDWRKGSPYPAWQWAARCLDGEVRGYIWRAARVRLCGRAREVARDPVSAIGECDDHGRAVVRLSRTESVGRMRRNLAAHERERIADEREAALDQREIRTAAHEAGTAARIDAVRVVLADAVTRDLRAAERDARADERERAASLDSFIHPDADQYDAAIKARRASALDRSESKSDRSSSADDRSKLTDG